MALTLEERQPRTEMQITSVDLGDSESVITAEGNMGEYGRVYASYHLSYNQDGTGGTSKCGHHLSEVATCNAHEGTEQNARKKTSPAVSDDAKGAAESGGWCVKSVS